MDTMFRRNTSQHNFSTLEETADGTAKAGGTGTPVSWEARPSDMNFQNSMCCFKGAVKKSRCTCCLQFPSATVAGMSHASIHLIRIITESDHAPSILATILLLTAPCLHMCTGTCLLPSSCRKVVVAASIIIIIYRCSS